MAALSVQESGVVVYPFALLSTVLLGLAIATKQEAPDDSTLLGRIASSGDQDALEQLYERHSRVVYAVLLRMTRDQSSSEELCQEVFFRLWKNAGSYDVGQGSLTPWLLTIARNAALDRIRSSSEKQRSTEFGSDEAIESPVKDRIDLWVDNKLQVDRALKLMDGLPDSQRQALELAYFDGLSQTEIAAQLGAPLGTVKSWVRGALLHLREQMGDMQ